MNTQNQPVLIEFPLRGEWRAPTTPADQIPSHGTNRMGLRYAFDFLQTAARKEKDHAVSTWQFLLFGAPLEKFYCWGAEIYAPCDGEIVAVVDGIPERKQVHWLRESLGAVKRSLTFNENTDDYSVIAGNYLVMKCSNGVFLAFVHLRTHSVKVTLHEKVQKGTLLGQVGHSGNSTSPHLHFQVMDSDDIKNANGIPCRFEEYQIWQGDSWQTVYNQIPASTDRIRFNK